MPCGKKLTRKQHLAVELECSKPEAQAVLQTQPEFKRDVDLSSSCIVSQQIHIAPGDRLRLPFEYLDQQAYKWAVELFRIWRYVR